MVQFRRGHGDRLPAESWEILEDPLRIVFHIRPEIHYQNKPPVNGREFVAEDVVNYFNYAAASPRLSPDRWDFVKEWTAPDKYTAVAELNNYFGNWEYELGWGAYVSIVPQEVIDAGPNDWRNLAGTGPFFLTDHISGSSTTWERNPDYWGTTIIDGQGYQLPFVDRVLFHQISEEQVADIGIEAEMEVLEPGSAGGTATTCAAAWPWSAEAAHPCSPSCGRWGASRSPGMAGNGMTRCTSPCGRRCVRLAIRTNRPR